MKAFNLMTLFATLAAVGCGADIGERIAVSGNVTYMGKPVRVGRILFTPEKGNAGPAAGGEIENGRFSIRASEGPHRGRYEISVTAGDLVRKQTTIGTKQDSETFPKATSQTFHFTKTIEGDESSTQINFDLAAQDSAS